MVPLRWRVVDADGSPVTTLTSVEVTAEGRGCSTGTTPDDVEEIAAGASGLLRLGNAGTCKTMRLEIGDRVTHDAVFNFTR